MRIVIAGGGEIGYQLACQLASIRDVVVIEQDPEVASRFDRLDLQVIRGNPTHPEKLRNARLTENDTFIACGESDELNIIACLAAKRAGGAQTFCFVSKEDYYRSLTSQNGEEPMLAIDRVIWPQHMLAEEIARIVLVPTAIDVEVFASGRVWLLEYRLQEESRFLGKPLVDLRLPRGVLAVAVMGDEELYVPSGRTQLHEGDKVVFMGKQRSLRKLERRFISDSPQKVRDVTVIGGGTVGLALAKRLLQDEDLHLKVIEQSSARCELLAAALSSALVLHGDGTDLELLESEQIYRSDVLVCVTSNDEKNLLSSLLGRRMKVPKIITRVDKPANLRLFESVGIDVPLNPRVTAIKTVINSLQDPNVQLLATVEQGKGDILQIVVPGDYPVTKVKDLRRIEGAIIAAIVRRHETVIPHGEDMIRPGDKLFVFCTQEASKAVSEYF